MYSHVNKVLKFGAGGRWGVQSPLIRVPRDEQLRSLWGSVQLGWYGTDIDGRIVCRMLPTCRCSAMRARATNSEWGAVEVTK